jgi:hypothetical protein
MACIFNKADLQGHNRAGLSLWPRAVCCVLFLTGCGYLNNEQTTAPGPAHPLALSANGLSWSSDSRAPLNLVVCWENPDAAEPLSGETARASGSLRREWARLALKQSWERVGRVVFSGWGTCQNEQNAVNPPHTLGPRRPGLGDENLKVFITSTGASQNAGHGSWGDHQKSGIRLNLHCNRSSNADLRACITYLAMHEFGHALGLYHEEERNDWPETIPGCPRQEHDPSAPWWPIPGPRLFGAFDRGSVMAYCSGQPQQLTEQDVVTIQSLYGRHLPGTLVAPHAGLCLAAHADAGNGAPVFGWECDEAKDDQEWIYDARNQSLSLRNAAAPSQRRCLDVDTNTQSKVQLWDCTGQRNQQWVFHSTDLRGYGGLCLRQDGNRIVTTNCDAGLSSWEVLPAGRSGRVQLKLNGQNLYITAAAQVGGNAAFAPRNARMIQEFVLASGGQIKLPDTNLCLDFRDVRQIDFLNGKGGPRPGLTLQSFTCLPDQFNQRFAFWGMIRSQNRCLTRAQGASANGANVIATDCYANVPENKWEYWW